MCICYRDVCLYIRSELYILLIYYKYTINMTVCWYMSKLSYIRILPYQLTILTMYDMR